MVAEQGCQLTSSEVDDTHHLDSESSVLYTQGIYTIYSFGSLCSAETKLTSISECRHAQSKFVSGDDVVTPQIGINVPKGCYRRKAGESYSWYFNKHETGSEKPVHVQDEYICLKDSSIKPRECI